MAAYAALYPFRLSLHEFLASSQASFVPTTQLQLLQSAYHQLDFFYQGIDAVKKSEREKALVEGIRDAVWRVEDKFDHHLSTHDFPSGHPLEFTHDFQAEIISFQQLVADTIKEFSEIQEEEEVEESESEEEEEESDDAQVEESDDAQVEEPDDDVQICKREKTLVYDESELLSTAHYGMVGLVDQFIQLRRELLLPQGGLYEVAIVGMAGIGKTAMAKQLYSDPLISKHFQLRGFVSVGRSPQLKQVLTDILSQFQDCLDQSLDIINMQSMSVKTLLGYLVCFVRYRRCLIVMDDVWSNIFPKTYYVLDSPESRILLTTRKESVAFDKTMLPGCERGETHLRLLNEDESWCLFCEKVFGKDSYCPYELVKVGKKIVENCEGLPLSVIAIADLLLAQGDTSVECWKKVSEDPNPLCIGTSHQHPSLNRLYSSYEELAERVKVHFLYMGIFPRKQDIPISKLTRLWEAERLVDPGSCQIHLGYIPRFTQFDLRAAPRSAQEWVIEIIENLSSHSVVFVTWPTLLEGFKTCRLHSVFWHLCVSEAKKEYIFQVVDKFSRNSFQENLNGHRRICVHNNTLFGVKDANNLMLSVSNARSLLCTGPYHPYPVPMDFKLMRLLRVLDVVTIRFYVFPTEIVHLVLLRYLAFTYNGKLNASISRLWNLESLIVEHHIRIVSLEDPLYMPMEIWNMKKLRHLQITGALLPNPPDGATLPNLSSISKIDARCLTTAVLGGIPNLLKLSIQIDISTLDPFSFSDHLSHVNTLLSLKCIVLNPKPRRRAIDPPAPSKIFPTSLLKLTLSGFGYSWKYFEEFGKFSSLQVLKLRSYAFQGPEWETSVRLSTLEVLHLEDLDLVRWRVTESLFPRLKNLSIKHCYRLQEIPLEFRHDHPWLKLIELVEVQPSVLASARNILQQRKKGYFELQLNIKCSFEEGN